MKKDKEIGAWARALFLALENKDRDEDKVIKNLILALDKKKYLLSSILKKYERIKNSESKIDVFVAKEIDENLKNSINQKVENLFGKGKDISYNVDEDLIGGFRIKTKDYLVKASIRDALIKIKNNAYGHN
ncbi:MAG: F0F1 ATP synthase subunit delta [Candidatus Pacebacteria bacterium]|nr:F0F1 ATP synthase subunit delta [Candidatus Paceibacterota bacterium]